MAGQQPRLSKYRLVARLGSGGMAEVYLVVAEGPGGFNKLQVLKLMRSDLSEQERPDFLQMFQDEARLAARLNHPNIVQSHEVGAEGGQPFLVMEYLDGQPLSRVQHRGRRAPQDFPVEMELSVLCQVLEALEYAHTLTDYDGTPLHIVHRDVSPQNVFITYAGLTKLVDFGVAKTLESSKTRAGVVKGKVSYMAPEQVRGDPVDHRADLFSVGVLLWEAIARRAMYADLSVYESINRLVIGDLPPLRDAAPDVPEELEQIVTRALQLKPEDRYPDADAFRHDLLGYLESRHKLRAREIGERVAKLFGRERSEINTVIQRAMGAGDGSDLTLGDFRMTRSLPDFGSSPAFLPDPSTPGRRTTPIALVSTPQPAAPAPSARAPRRRWLPMLATLLALSAASALAVSLRSFGGRARGTSDEPDALAASAGVADRVELSIEAEPRGATLVLDGVRLGDTPYRGQRARDLQAHTLEVSAPGHKPLRTSVRFDADVQLKLQLGELAPTPPQAERRASSRVEPHSAEPAPRSPRRARPARSPRHDEESDDPYGELPPVHGARPQAPELDRSDPWAPERAP